MRNAVASAAVSAVTSVVLLSCAESNAPARPIPATLEVVANTASSATVGSEAGSFIVRVRDGRGAPISGVMVSFTVSLGGGRVEPVADTTGADGSTMTVVSVGTVPGQNQVTATVHRLAPATSAVTSGIAGPSSRIAINPPVLRIPAARNIEPIGAVARDGFGNATGSTVSWTSRNAGLVGTSAPTGGNVTLQVASRPGQTYVVASADGIADSILVSVLDASSTACSFEASPSLLAVGESLSFETTGAVCVRSEGVGAEYAVISHYATAAATAFTSVEVTARGIVTPTPLPENASVAASESSAGHVADLTFERALRERESREIGSRVPAARNWLGSRPPALTVGLKEGDVTQVNVNAFDFCSSPDVRSARVAAITSTAVILADLENPPGGFTDSEYRAFGITIDTLVHPLGTQVFGLPSDIDGNGRVAVLFTSAVNEITPRGSTSGVVLGFFYSRDLLPRRTETAICPGSNLAEMFYVIVPDTGGALSDRRSKDFVANLVIGTVAHEFQHLISASRRLYITRSSSPTEELWLNEGLSHIAEELLFYRASQLAPRQNLGATALQDGGAARTAFDNYARSNLARYAQYLRSPELNSPISTEDFIATRGAAWSFLRYLADHSTPAADGDLWYRIVNGQATGMGNLDDALAGTGLTTLGLLMDWSASVLADDFVPQAKLAFQQPSWDFVSGMPAVGLSFGLAPVTLVNGLISATPLRAGGSSYMRFGTAPDQEALIRVTGPGGRIVSSGVRLTVVRTR